jgi:hypothetical protein
MQAGLLSTLILVHYLACSLVLVIVQRFRVSASPGWISGMQSVLFAR